MSDSEILVGKNEQYREAVLLMVKHYMPYFKMWIKSTDTGYSWLPVLKKRDQDFNLARLFLKVLFVDKVDMKLDPLRMMYDPEMNAGEEWAPLHARDAATTICE